MQGRQRQLCLHRLQHLWRQRLLLTMSPSYGRVVPGDGALPASMLHRLPHQLPQGPHELQVRTFCLACLGQAMVARMAATNCVAASLVRIYDMHELGRCTCTTPVHTPQAQVLMYASLV